ncbi:MAG TPA: TraR/DksA C4-type zinc finger protein [Niabella sp.]|nr:TraR/DksA C4-type zinc finger protein [Niabella sp.]HOZ98322.1 TraR/DksA C4-type zinc finger protein [Niabella sp.]HQW13401.1 TraR/DksA C4-type zinc finger protein [Niabella sp.]HQX18795.1 TraR/DksA C4-type zinc finger protein [Niabella sp.]HQX42026.1 TraR/DksA C4-type zinc finger protein [Niabella sp.]
MATKKNTPVKKITPAKKLSKPTEKSFAAPAKKEVAKKAIVKAASKKTAPAKKAAPVKTVAQKSAPVKLVAKKVEVKQAPVKEVKKSKVETKPVAKLAPKKAQPVKPTVVPKLTTKSAVKYHPDFTQSILDSPKQEKAKAVIRYSDSELQEFKEIILRKLDAAKKELVYLQGLITRRDEGGDMDEGRYMTMEDGSLSMEREQLSQMASRQISFIDKLEKALMRVENKSYGICRVTGNLIDKARLRAVPHATLSMEAKSSMNK